MPKRSSKMDFNQMARLVVEQAIKKGAGDYRISTTSHKNPAAVALGSLGGKKGGPARAKSLTAKERSDIAKKAAKARWKKKS